MGKGMKGLSAVLAIVALIGLVTSGMTVNDVLAGKSYYEQKDVESTANLNKLQDGLDTLMDNEQTYVDGLKTYEDGQKTLEEGKATLAQGYIDYAKGQQDYADGEAKLAAGKKTLDENKAAYEKGKKDYAAGLKELAAGKKTLANGRATLTSLLNNIAQLNNSYSSAWRPGFEAVKAAGYVTEGTLDKKKAATDKANLEAAIPAYEGVAGLEKNGATPAQAQQMVTASVAKEQGISAEQAAAVVQNALNNSDNIKAVKAGVDKLMAGYSEDEAQATAEAGVLKAAKAGDEQQQAAAGAYETVKPVLAQVGDLDTACAAIVKAGAAQKIQNDSDTMAAITAGVKQALAEKGMTEDSEGYAEALEAGVKAEVEKQAAAYAASEAGQTQAGQLKAGYNGINDKITEQKNTILAAKDNYEVACAVAAASNNMTAEQIDTAYKGYAVVAGYERLQKPTAEGGIAHEEAVAAVASSAGVTPAIVETAYTTVNEMGGADAAKKNVSSLDALSKDGGQIDQLRAGRATLQGYLNQILDGISGNADLSAAVPANEVKALKALLSGSDAHFEAGADAFFAKAAQLSGVADTILAAGQKKLDDGAKQLAEGKAKLDEYEDGLATYKQGVKDLAAGAAKLADAEQQLADGEKAVADGEQQLAAGAAKLAEYEDGLAQIKDGLQTAHDTEADPGIESVAARLGDNFSFLKDGPVYVDFQKGQQVVDSAWAYKSDDGAAITDEMYTRIYGAVAAVIASVMALVAAFLGFKKKYKGALPCAAISAVGAVAATIFANKAGMYFSALAGSTMGSVGLYAGIALAAVALIHAVGDGVANKEA